MKNKTKEQLLEIIQTSHNENEKWKANVRLRHIMESWSDDELRKSLANGSEIEKTNADFHLWLRHQDRTYEGLTKFLNVSRDEDRLRMAAILLGENIKNENAVEYLIQILLSDCSRYVKEGAALGLREIANKTAFSYILDEIKKDPNGCETFVYALGVFDCSSIVDFLVKLFISQPEAFLLRIEIIECLKNPEINDIPQNLKNQCYHIIKIALEKTDSEENKGQLKGLYEVIKNLDTL